MALHTQDGVIDDCMLGRQRFMPNGKAPARKQGVPTVLVHQVHFSMQSTDASAPSTFHPVTMGWIVAEVLLHALSPHQAT